MEAHLFESRLFGQSFLSPHFLTIRVLGWYVADGFGQTAAVEPVGPPIAYLFRIHSPQGLFETAHIQTSTRIMLIVYSTPSVSFTFTIRKPYFTESFIVVVDRPRRVLLVSTTIAGHCQLVIICLRATMTITCGTPRGCWTACPWIIL
jgi:hypothetical protein